MAQQTRMTLQEAVEREPDVDWVKVDATTDEDIRRHKVEDGHNPDTLISADGWSISAATVRGELGMSQSAFADLIHVPIGTIRTWEQGRVIPDPAARALLMILWREPEAALRALSSRPAA